MDQVSTFYLDAYKAKRPYLIERIKEILVIAEALEGSLRRKFPEFGASVTICCATERLDTAITSYFYDLHRYKHFHGMLDTGNESRTNLQKNIRLQQNG